MGRIWMPGGGGGGVSSDELTATLADVIKGKTVVTSDSGDEIGTGTLQLTGDAAVGDVVSGKGFYTTDPKTKRIGTLVDKNGTTQSATASLDATNSRLLMTIPALGRYSTASKLYAAYSTIRTLIGLTAAKIATGSTILGLAGTYKGLGDAVAANVLAGKKFSTAALSNATGTMTDRGAVAKTITPSAAVQTYTIAAGYHNGSGKVTVNAIPSTYLNITGGVSFFKDGVLGPLYSQVGFTNRYPFTSIQGATLSSSNPQEWKTITAVIDGFALGSSKEMNFKDCRGFCLKKTIDFTHLNTLKLYKGGSYYSGHFFDYWFFSPDTLSLTKTGRLTLSGDTLEVDISDVKGQQLFGMYDASEKTTNAQLSGIEFLP